MRGNVKRKSFPSELKPGENSWHSAPPTYSMPTRMISCPALQARFVADQREARDGHWFLLPGFPSWWNVFSERPGAVKGAPIRRGAANLDGEDCSEMMVLEGKQVRTGLRSISEALASADGIRRTCVNHGSICGSRPMAFFGYPRGHRVNTET
jgi:hypothetical protein